jgi:hypothetical protein
MALLPYGHVVYYDEFSASKAREFPNHVLLGKKVSITVHKINVQKKLNSAQAEEIYNEDLLHYASRPSSNPLYNNNNNDYNNNIQVQRDHVIRS